MLSKIDHLIYFVPNLSEGIDEIESVLGVQPIIGGKHPAYGTHNALVSLGKSTYLEIMAHDAHLPEPGRGRLFSSEIDRSQGRLVAWIMKTDTIDSLAADCLNAGLPIGDVQSGSRITTAGTTLTWTLTDPYAISHPSVTPFLIDWRDTPHPATTSPAGGTLVDLMFEHPDPDLARDRFQVLGVDFAVTQASTPRLVAKLRTLNGEVLLS